MAVSIPRNLIDFVLLGSVHNRRQLQDSPILGDVWLAFAANPADAIELLIAPKHERAASEVAVAIHERIRRGRGKPLAEVAPLHGIVAARLTFRRGADDHRADDDLVAEPADRKAARSVSSGTE